MKKILCGVFLVVWGGVLSAFAGGDDTASLLSSVPARVTMSTGERLMGFYTTDALPSFSSAGYVKLNSEGAIPVGALFDDAVLGNFVGGEIVRFRFAVACDVEVVRAFIYPVTTSVHIEDEPLVDIAISSTLSAGWYDVELDEPLTIAADQWYLLGFEYVETATNAPLATDGELNADYTSDWGILAYGDFGQGNGWYTFGNTYGDICVQAVVRGGTFADDDIVLAHLATDNRLALHKDLDYSVDVKNMGNNTPSTYTLQLSIDGTEMETLVSPVALTGMYQTVTGTLDMSNIDEGRHVLTIAVVDIDGHAPTERVDDDVVEASFVVYDKGVERQKHLIEAFTSTLAGSCVNGDKMIDVILEKYPDKYVPVQIHINRFGDDPLYVPDGPADYLREFTGCTYYPSATFSRAFLSTSRIGGVQGVLTISMGYGVNYQDEEAGYIDEAVEEAFADYPAFVSVDIATTYDEDTRELTITVYGEGIDAARQVLAGNRLTIYLTEDNVVAPQYTTNDGYIDDYVHNHALRLIANEYAWGDEIDWKEDNRYENTVTVTLADDWDVYNMHVVAFISGPMAVWKNDEWYYADQSEGVVNNANTVQILAVPEAISVVNRGITDGEERYYTTDGRRVSAPVEGVTIVRHADGTTQKILTR